MTPPRRILIIESDCDFAEDMAAALGSRFEVGVDLLPLGDASARQPGMADAVIVSADRAGELDAYCRRAGLDPGTPILVLGSAAVPPGLRIPARVSRAERYPKLETLFRFLDRGGESPR